MDFNADLVRIAKALLDHYEVAHSDISDGRLIVERWANTQFKLIKSQPRTVHQSSRLKSRQISADVNSALATVEQKCVKGDDLNPHLSKTIFKPDFPDYLFADWGICHLHLSTTRKGKFFMDRSSELLFAMFTPRDAFLIDIRPHDEKYVFAQKELLETLHSEWPHLIGKYRLKGFDDISHTVDDADQIEAMRKAGINVIQKVGDAIYAPMGGGVTTAATATIVTIEVDRLYIQIESAKKYVKNNWLLIEQKIAKSGGIQSSVIDLHLELTEQGFCIVDRNSGCGFPLN